MHITHGLITALATRRQDSSAWACTSSGTLDVLPGVLQWWVASWCEEYVQVPFGVISPADVCMHAAEASATANRAWPCTSTKLWMSPLECSSCNLQTITTWLMSCSQGEPQFCMSAPSQMIHLPVRAAEQGSAAAHCARACGSSRALDGQPGVLQLWLVHHHHMV